MSSVAIVTPWFEHRELWPDYRGVIDDARADELLLVDNGSDPALHFATIRLDENRGFSGGSNTGLHAAHTDAVVFLNSDVYLADGIGWLDRLMHAIEPGVLVGPVLRSDPHAYVDGRVMPYLDGWCLAGMRDDLLAIGGFDEALAEPAYYSDNLLCLEARAAGMTLREVTLGLGHKGGVTSQPDVNPQVRRATAYNRDLYIARARELLVPV